MALSKKQISYLSVAVLAGGIIAGEGVGLYKLNNQVQDLHNKNTKLEQTIDSLNKDIKKKDATIDNVTKERDTIKESHDNLETEKNDLQNQLEQKKKEVSALKVSKNADYPTQSVSRGVTSRRGTPVTMRLSFYGDFAHENGGYAGIDAQGNKLVAGTVASNVYAFGTQFNFNGQIYTVRDRGGSHFNSSDRLDVFVPRNPGESNAAYAKRISDYGRQTVTMYKL